LHLPQVGLCPSLEDGNLFAAPQLLHLTWYSMVFAIPATHFTVRSAQGYSLACNNLDYSQL
jgi:hypothetical protein